MKKLFLLIALFLPSVAIKAQDIDVRNVIRYNFFGAFGKSFTGEFERVLNNKFSVQIAVGYRSINTAGWEADEIKYDFFQKGYTVVPEVKYYWTNFSKTLINPTGAYVAPFARIGYYNMELKGLSFRDHDLTYDLTTIGGGIVMGFQLVAGRVFAMDIFMGPQVKYKAVSNMRGQISQTNQVSIDKDGLTTGARFGFSIGFAF